MGCNASNDFPSVQNEEDKLSAVAGAISDCVKKDTTLTQGKRYYIVQVVQNKTLRSHPSSYQIPQKNKELSDSIKNGF